MSRNEDDMSNSEAYAELSYSPRNDLLEVLHLPSNCCHWWPDLYRWRWSLGDPVILHQVCAARLQKTFLEAQEKVECEWIWINIHVLHIYTPWNKRSRWWFKKVLNVARGSSWFYLQSLGNFWKRRIQHQKPNMAPSQVSPSREKVMLDLGRTSFFCHSVLC